MFHVYVAASVGLTLEERTLEGDTCLTLAVRAGLVENVELLLEHGASPHTTNTKKESALLLGHILLPQSYCFPTV